jgi:hypothetical protein
LPQTYEFALRDAAARFEETRRLAAEKAVAEQQLIELRSAREADIAHAAERQTALELALTTAKHEKELAASREIVELGARAQQADWRTRQAQKAAAEAEEQRKHALEQLRTVQAESAGLRAEVIHETRMREEAQTRAEALTAREAELVEHLRAEREARRLETERLSTAASHAVGEASQRFLGAMRESTESRRVLQKVQSRVGEAEERAEAQREATIEADARAAQAESRLLDERSKLERSVELVTKLEAERRLFDEEKASAVVAAREVSTDETLQRVGVRCQLALRSRRCKHTLREWESSIAAARGGRTRSAELATRAIDAHWNKESRGVVRSLLRVVRSRRAHAAREAIVHGHHLSLVRKLAWTPWSRDAALRRLQIHLPILDAG